MSKCLCLCDYSGAGLAAERLPVHVIGCCSEGKHYLRSVEPVKCSRCAFVCVCVNVVSAESSVCTVLCVCWLMLDPSHFKLWPSV